MTAQTKAKSPKPMRQERPAFFCQFSCRLYIMVMGRRARARSMNASQPNTIISASFIRDSPRFETYFL